MGDGAFLARHRTALLALALSLLTHAVLLWVFGHDALRGGALVRERPSATVVRFVQLPPPDSAPPDVRLGEERTEPSARPPGVSRPVPGPSPQVVERPQPAPPGAAERPPTEVATKPGGPLPELHYFSPEELSVKPQVVSDAGAAEPTFIPDVFPLPVVVQLLINERGDVDKVVLGDNFLSDVAKKHIVDSFSGMKFSPGMLGSRPVKSQLRIVVTLDPAVPVN